jgi:hypothetical protein
MESNTLKFCFYGAHLSSNDKSFYRLHFNIPIRHGVNGQSHDSIFTSNRLDVCLRSATSVNRLIILSILDVSVQVSLALLSPKESQVSCVY